MIEQTKVQVKSICADYFMESSFTQPDKKKVQNSIDILNHLIDVAPSLGVENIVIPCVDQSSLNSPEKQSLFVEYVSSSLALAEKNKVNLALETDLGPKEFKHLLNCFHSPNLTVNYDIGNSASLGFNIEDELITYGSKITDIHIKDRTLNGGSIFLGNGNADFKKFYQLLSKIKYQGIFVMQVYRDDEGLDIFKKQLNWILPILEEYEMKTFYGK
jgi:sugar phosphate isomerase/epimerase